MPRNVFQLMKSRILSLEEHVACAVQTGKVHSSSSENLQESVHFGDQLQVGS